MKQHNAWSLQDDEHEWEIGLVADPIEKMLLLRKHAERHLVLTFLVGTL